MWNANSNSVIDGDEEIASDLGRKAPSSNFTLLATKRFYDHVGSVGISSGGKFVVAIQGDETDVFRSPIARVVIKYIAAMDDFNPYPESGGDENQNAPQVNWGWLSELSVD